MDILKAKDEDILKETQRIREAFKLKQTLRYESVRDNKMHSESVAEHIFGMLVLVDYFLPLEDPKGEWNREKIRDLILYHEIGEIELGDTMFNKKSDEQSAEEELSAKRTAKKLPSALGERALAAFHEFETPESPEAQFAVAIDKIEPIFELLTDIGTALYRQHGITKTVAIGGKMAATHGYPHIRRFLDAWTNWMVSLNAFASDE